MITLTPEAEALGGDATPPAAATSPPLADERPDLAPVDVPAPPSPSAAFLARAQELLGCERYQDEPLVSNCWTHTPGTLMSDLTWPCVESKSLAALLAEVAAEALEDVAGAFASSANRVVKAKGETERTRYANEVAEVLRNRADEVRRG